MAISSLIHQGEIDQATRLLEATVEVSEGDAAYWYLSWLVEMERAQGESSERALELFAKAEQLNPHVSKLMEMAVEKMSYPKSVALTPGSHEEAHYIWYLL